MSKDGFVRIKVSTETRRKLRLLAALLDMTMLEAAELAISEALRRKQAPEE